MYLKGLRIYDDVKIFSVLDQKSWIAWLKCRDVGRAQQTERGE